MKRGISVAIVAILTVAGAVGALPAGFEPDIAGNASVSSEDSITMADQIRRHSRILPSREMLPLKKTVKEGSVAYASGDGTKLYGGVVYSDGWSSSHAPFGIYSTTSASPLKVEPFYLGDMYKMGGGGFYAEGKYYCIDYEIRNFDNQEVVYTTLYINDANPFKYVSSVSLGMSHIAKDLTFDPIEQRAYGIFSVGSLENRYLLGTMNLKDYRIEELFDLDRIHVAIASDPKGNIYTIGEDGVLYRLDKEENALVSVGQTGVAVDNRYAQSATFDMETGTLYWAALHSDLTTALYKVDTSTGHASKIGDFPDNEEFAGLYIPDVTAPGAPASVDELFTDFIDGALEGVVAFDAPKVCQDGSQLSGEITYRLKINGDEVSSGSVRAGKRNFEIDVTLPENGYYTFTLTLENAAGKSFPTSLREYMGQDSPSACTEASATNSDRGGVVSLKWRKPRGSMHGGYVDFPNITYDVMRLPDNVAVATALTDTVFTDHIESTALKCYRYMVTPVSHGQKGVSCLTNKVAVGHVAEVPYNETFDTSVDFGTFSVIDVDKDAEGAQGTWGYSGYKEGVATATPAGGVHTGNAKDDWLFTPPVHLRNDRTYKVIYQAMSQGNSIVPSFREYMEVKLGNAATVEAMTETLLENSLIDNEYTKYNTYEHEIHVDTEGEYHIGFHATTPGDDLMWNLVIDNLRIVEGAMADGPSAVTGLSVTAGEKGAYEALIAFIAPTVAIDATPLETLEKIEVIRDGDVIKTFAPAVPGQAYAFTDKQAKQGVNEYRVVAYDGKNRGLESVKKVFVGYDIPGTVNNLTVRDIDGKVIVSWEAPSTDGPEGHYVDPAKVTYTVVRYFNEYNSQEVAKGLSALSFTDSEVTAGVQTQVAYRVTATNTVGTGKTAVSPSIFVGGEDSQLPIHESFPGQTSTSPVLRYLSSETGAQWGVAAEIDAFTPYDNDRGMALFGLNGYGIPGEDGLSAMLYTNRISLDATLNASLSFYCNVEDGTRNRLEVVVNPETKGWQTVKTVTAADFAEHKGWQHVVVPLDEFAGYRYVQLGFRGTGWDEGLIFVDNIYVDDMLADNLELTSISTHYLARPGDRHEVKVTVTNRGQEDADEYKVRLKSLAGDFSTEVEGRNIEPGNSTYFMIDFPVTLGTPESNDLQAEILYEYDLKESDNMSEVVTVSVDLPNMAYVTALDASRNGSEVSLSWDEPDITTARPEPSVDTFDDYAPFIIDGVGDWTMHDGDGQASWGISDGTGNGSILKYENAGKAMAWQVFNPVLAGLSVDYNESPDDTMEYPDWRPYSGSQMLISYAPRTGFSDDWLISEELDGNRQIITFMGRSIMTTYKERVEVLASSTDADPESFSLIATCAFGKKWTQFGAVLPEGTRYFAIRCTSPQQFAAIIDDVSFVKAGTPVSPSVLEGYNVYCDGVKINSEPVTARTYTTSVNGAAHSYRVTAVYDRGESRMSPAASIEGAGIEGVAASEYSVTVQRGYIVVSGLRGESVAITAMDGRTVSSCPSMYGTLRIPVATGIYLVSVNGTASKVVVK